MIRYRAEVITLDGVRKIKVSTVDGYHVGYFATPEAVTDHGHLIDWSTVEIVRHEKDEH